MGKEEGTSLDNDMVMGREGEHKGGAGKGREG
jgi:hypothetical protein